MNVTLTNDNGNINIDSGVIAIIAGNVALNGYGVVGMSSRKPSDDVAEILGIENITKGITVDVQDNKVTISLHVIVKYGIAINTVANNIISAVHYTVEKMTGVNVAWVKFFVEGVRL